jgi:flagella basal body P-ring formation protein FlgA
VRLGPEAEVRVEQLVWRLFAEPGDDLTAVPEPGARLGRTVRFSLHSTRTTDRRRVGTAVGHATGTLHAVLPHARAARTLETRTVIGPGDLVECRGEVGSVPLARVPVAGDLKGGLVARRLVAGEVVLTGVVIEPPLVQAGQIVGVRMTAPGMTVWVQAVAAEAGRRGEMIRVVNPSSRRALRVQVTGPGETEVMR